MSSSHVDQFFYGYNISTFNSSLFKISLVNMILCKFQSCISYQSLQNSANLSEIGFQYVQAEFILQRFCTSLADSDNSKTLLPYNISTVLKNFQRNEKFLSKHTAAYSFIVKTSGSRLDIKSCSSGVQPKASMLKNITALMLSKRALRIWF
ncbi:hypothetical protein BpHYR1_045143 [Brachionus plicatilis]|uniref:Uncharacterized protein n=1 Tax=Brachionus plicatilis TaxID=10195 RepID=A0A3M7QPI3_BRAPC|nr:hypothetical protein BpHYR1_045143 [Brachionus plicatilis]